MAETRHVKLNYEEALDAKKQILSAQLNLLQTAKRVRNYKVLRKRELTTKTKLKANLKSLRTKIKALQTSFPHEEDSIEKIIIKKRAQKRKDNDIKEQLKDIEKKLDNLNK